MKQKSLRNLKGNCRNLYSLWDTISLTTEFLDVAKPRAKQLRLESNRSVTQKAAVI